MARLRLLAAVLLVLTAGARAADRPTPGAAGLEGTWRWVSFESPVEKLVVKNPDQYLLTFPEPGRIALKADCNRAAGGVTLGKDGAIKVGVLAMTRAMCPEGSLSDRFAQTVGRAVMWSKRGSDLLLDLPADGGTLRFTKAP